MKYSAILILGLLLASCTIHFHVHEAPKPAVVAQAGAGTAQLASDRRMVRGVVRTREGAGVIAHVAVVGSSGGGSNTTSTRPDGRFELPETGSPDFAVHASTEDGQVAIAQSHSRGGEVELVLDPGAIFVVELEGREKARFAVFVDGLRIEDFTLKAGEPATVVVPVGESRFQIYEGNNVLQERHFTASAGHREKVSMRPHS